MKQNNCLSHNYYLCFYLKRRIGFTHYTSENKRKHGGHSFFFCSLRSMDAYTETSGIYIVLKNKIQLHSIPKLMTSELFKINVLSAVHTVILQSNHLGTITNGISYIFWQVNIHLFIAYRSMRCKVFSKDFLE